MSLLLKEIQDIDEKATDRLKQAELYTDSDIEALTREEILQLFPAVTDLKLRRAIYDAIHKPREVELVLNELKGFIPIESFRAALTDNGVLVDYLRILKDMKTQMDNVQGFLEAHISLLEEFSKNQPDQGSANCGPVTNGCPGEAQDSLPGSGNADARGKKLQKIGTTGGHRPEPQKSLSGPSTSVELHSGQPGGAQGCTLTESSSGPSPSVTGGPVEPHSGKNDGRARVAPAALYKMVVGGKTFDTHLKLMETVEKRVQNQLRHCEGNQENQITFVFCPISSRIESDVEAAMSNVTDNKPVILVLMHHTHEVRPTSMRTWHEDARVVLHVNVFYHETVGLLKCERNDAAVTEIQTKLMESFIQRSKDTSGNAQGVGDDQKGGGSWFNSLFLSSNK
ncbi:uncharacterized protein LOC142941577 isoform X1 [Anarhichas minor]|uniref:uncharacterized protein LOC142941577 isoform X1 n=1 Tax=Anarhichas minor TaxID=65739 RepID=UPI003F737A5A